jgi:hypothetical protein
MDIQGYLFGIILEQKNIEQSPQFRQGSALSANIVLQFSLRLNFYIFHVRQTAKLQNYL